MQVKSIAEHQGEHSAILSAFIKLPFVIKIFVVSVFEWPFYTGFTVLVRKKIRKRRLFKKVQAFCEEKVLRCLLGVFWYAESKNQCWQAEKWRLHYLICIFPRWPPN